MTLAQQVAENARAAGIVVPRHTCSACAGRGAVPLASYLLEVWHALSETEGRTALEVGESTRTTGQSAKTRLGVLASLGLARVVGQRPPRTNSGKSCRPAAEWVRTALPEVPHAP